LAARIGTLLIAAACAILCAGAAPPAASENGIEVGASENHVFIEPNFAGTRITIFGAIDGAQFKPLPGASYGLAISIRGPSENLTVWKKERVAGIWVNRRGVTFSGAPSFYRVISTKPLADIAPEAERKEAMLGIGTLMLTPSLKDAQILTPDQIADYRKAAIRLKKEGGLYAEQAGGIDFLGDRLFRARADLPASVPPGLYRASVFLIEKGKIASRSTSYIRVQKVGIERFLSAVAQEQPLIYGLGAVLMAALLGGFSSLVLRRR
jgi:uncharacterized protein (TIGR02186 family)